MRRRNISGNKHGRKFQKARNKHKRINEGGSFMRGGIRL